MTDPNGLAVLDYRRPDSDPGRKEYTPFTKPLESPRKPPEQMSVEELVLAAEFRLKELDPPGATALLEKALERDPGCSRAHLLLGVQAFTAGRHEDAVRSLEKAIARDPYADEAYYYLAMSQFALGRDKEGERNLHYIWPNSAYYGEREFHLGRLKLRAGDSPAAIERFRNAVDANARDLLSRLALALLYRESGRAAEAREHLAAVERLDPNHRVVFAEKYLASAGKAAERDLLGMLGGQSQEAISVSNFYRQFGRWKEAVRLMRLVQSHNEDPWGTPPEFYYTLAYCQKRAGDANGAEESLRKARAAAGNINRFPYREEAEPVLLEAVAARPDDALARFCWAASSITATSARRPSSSGKPPSRPILRISRRVGRWDWPTPSRAFLSRKPPRNWSARSNFSLANVRALNDLGSLYARAGRFRDQLNLLKKGLAQIPSRR